MCSKLFKYILNLLLIVLMVVSLSMITYGNVDTISGINIIGFILTIASFFMAVIINNDET